MNRFLSSMTNKTYTQNSALTHKSTESAVLDFFSRAGGLRGDSQTAYKLFLKAVAEDAELAFKALFWLRDIRGGAGERDLFRNILSNFYSNQDSYIPSHLVKLIPEYGRWDDLICLYDPFDSGTEFVLKIVAEQYQEDIFNMESGKPVSLLAKWMPSINTSSEDSRRKAKYIADYLGLTPKWYRQALSALRRYIKVVEQQMSAGEWTEINYESVPSRASMIYRKAFARHDSDGYAQYLNDVESGKKEIKSGTLYPYDIVRKVLQGSTDKTLELQWKHLPDYLSENPHNGLVVCDTSGSMMSGINNLRPIDVSVSLALYIAERNEGAFHNYFLTFSSHPQLQPIVGKDLFEKIRNLEDADWAMNTDLEAVFKLILGRAKLDNVPESDMPKILYIISDMEFDRCVDNPYATNFENIRQMYQNAGYDLPQVVFWNVNSKSNQSPVTMHESGTALVSGASPAIFTSLLSGMNELEQMTPYNMMLKTLLSERYAAVRLDE